jgi:two-component system phosphate regulon sensor histidine kinase PhoR
MKKNKISTPLSLMILSIALLVILQALWLRTEYRSAENTFSRETSVIFRSTLFQLSDSIFYRSINSSETNDTLNDSERFMKLNSRYETIRHIFIEPDTLHSNHDADTTEKSKGRRMTIFLSDPENPADSIRVSRRISSSHDMRWFFTDQYQNFSTEIIAKYYKRNLASEYEGLKLSLKEKEFSPPSERSQFQRQDRDSLPFSTPYYPFAGKLYSAEFHNGKILLLKQILPQAGFSLFTTLLIITAFYLVFRNLRNQQKLLLQKDNFISNVTHELKTPVASVGVALEAIKNFNVLEDKIKTKEYLELAGNELNRLEMMADKILKTSVHDYGKEIETNKAPVAISEIVEKVISSFRILAEQKGIDFSFQNEGDSTILGNREHLTQMIYNLVDNAVKYAAEGKEINITTGEIPDAVILEVKDKGPGIEPAHRSKIFEKFYRVPTGNVHNVKGYGLGLHYVEGVVKHHNGKISLESRIGKGCRFVVKLPK